MSTAVATISNSASRYDQADIVNTIRQTVAKGANDAQLRMFLEVCKRTGLDPFLKEIWYVPEKGIIMAGRDGYLRVANENPNFDGMETRVERDEKNVPIKAVCTVWRKDRTHAIICEAYYSEYKKSSPVWSQYPSAMISKVAEVLALKRSFAINGVVTEEEIGDGSGSASAAQVIAEQKIEAMKAGVPAAELVEVLPREESAAPDLTEQLQQSIDHARKTRARKSGTKLDLLRAFQDLKKRYQAIDAEKTYYAVLGRFGYEHSNEFPDTPEGMEQARHAYKEMSLNVADMEAMAKAQQEKAAEGKSAGQKAGEKFWEGRAS